MMGDLSVMTDAMSYLDGSEPWGTLATGMSREATSGDPAPSRSLRAPEVGTQRPRGGGR